MPAGTPLDGELWAGRGRFEEARQAVQFHRWTDRMRFLVFDAPAVLANWCARMATVATLTAGRARVHAVGFERLTGFPALEMAFDRVKAIGGEGLMLRDPDAIGYESGRTDHLLKVKLPPRLRRGRL